MIQILLIVFHFLFQGPNFNQDLASISLTVSNCRSNQGMVRILIFDQESGFPDNRKKALKSISLPIKNQESKIAILDLKPGKYSISTFHDEDENGELNKNPFGYPSEKYGFSNNPRVIFTPPSFEKCSFELKANQVREININLR
ncbi:DUF2141 domain-containing protein [Algoriphagus algorifonticola]|uniref:DUF2141 domain-containing protein n=1 Tax=Algoriphagus algorifonticola TaxID=2593007 RepID=UPI0011AA55DD|nr:DUF2141 domain-containing protein [Algoriphagus algorifonticola]